MEEMMCYIPENLEEALAIMDERDAMPLAGGSDLMVSGANGTGVNPTFSRPVVIITNLPELKGIKVREDGWTEMMIAVNDCAKSWFYLADTLTELNNFWPVATPDLAWLEREYAPVPGCQYYCQKEGFGEGKNTAIFYSSTFAGEYQTKNGAPFSLLWSFFPKINQPSDNYMVDNTLDKTEAYTTQDGIIVTIEWRTSMNGQNRFDAEVDYGFARFHMSGAEMELEEIKQILDHVNLSALLTYKKI